LASQLASGATAAYAMRVGGGGGGVDFASMRFATGNSFSRRPSGGSGLRDGLLCLGHARACELNPRCRAGYLRDVEYFSRD
jgi:hypothetical protein